MIDAVGQDNEAECLNDLLLPQTDPSGTVSPTRVSKIDLIPGKGKGKRTAASREDSLDTLTAPAVLPTLMNKLQQVGM